MDYKRIISNRELRRKILRLLCFIPDKCMLRLQYRIKMGRPLNLKEPQRYTEKIQWYKLYYKKRKMIEAVDKYDVRRLISDMELETILPQCYGVYDSYEDIVWEKLPEKFVIKDTLAGGGTSVIVVKKKDELDYVGLRDTLKKWTQRNSHVKSDGREWPYYSGKNHRILIEEYLETTTGETLTDYKFFCFDGKVYCVYVIGNREIGNHGQLAIMDEEFVRLPYQSVTQETMKDLPKKPKNYDYMIEVAKKISSGYPHVRVDLYNVDGKVYFGEMTFFGASGYQKFCPDEFDYILGKQFVLPKKR